MLINIKIVDKIKFKKYKKMNLTIQYKKIVFSENSLFISYYTLKKIKK